jgi:hypothetical protein
MKIEQARKDVQMIKMIVENFGLKFSENGMSGPVDLGDLEGGGKIAIEALEFKYRDIMEIVSENSINFKNFSLYTIEYNTQYYSYGDKITRSEELDIIRGAFWGKK